MFEKVPFNLRTEVKISVYCFFNLWIWFEYHVEEAIEYICYFNFTYNLDIF